jgi:DNA-binding response OmpR family regulator
MCSRVVERQTRRVLVIDDNPDITSVLSWGLGHLGYDVRTANDGASGLDAALEFQPHAALIDLSLPVIDGWTLAEQFRKHPTLVRPRLIAMTGYSSVVHRSRSATSGFDEHLVKPISLAKLDALLSA